MMRELAIARLTEIFRQNDEYFGDWEDLVNFAVPTTVEEIGALSDEELIELMLAYGTFLG